MLVIEYVGPGCVTLSGRFDASETEHALAALSRISESAVADCSGLEYISSAGIGVLVHTCRRLHDLGYSFRLSNATPRVRNVFRYAGLSGLFGIE